MGAEISVIWSKLTIYPKFQLRLYGHFGYMVNFSRTKPWTLYPKSGVSREMERKVHDRSEDIIRRGGWRMGEWVGMRKRKKLERRKGKKDPSIDRSGKW